MKARLWQRSRQFGHLLRIAAAEVSGDRLFVRAMALAYLTLLALVPIATIGIVLFARFGIVSKTFGRLKDAVLYYALPETVGIVVDYVERFASRATTVGVIGFGVFAIMAVSLFNNIVRAFNDIWGVPEKRRFIMRLVAFWCFVTIFPILVGLSVYLTATFTELDFVQGLLRIPGMKTTLDIAVPGLLSCAALMLSYMILPNTKVRWLPALIGASVAALCWEGAKFGFDYYLTHVVAYHKLYGALGVIPIFLFWLYITWAIVLLGAEMTFLLQRGNSGTK